MSSFEIGCETLELQSFRPRPRSSPTSLVVSRTSRQFSYVSRARGVTLKVGGLTSGSKWGGGGGGLKTLLPQ